MAITYEAERGLGWWRSRELRRANAEIRTVLQALTFPTPSGACGVVLDELLGVPRNDIEHWARLRETQQFYRGTNLLDDVLEHLTRAEILRAGERIDMHRLAKELRVVLDR